MSTRKLSSALRNGAEVGVRCRAIDILPLRGEQQHKERDGTCSVALV